MKRPNFGKDDIFFLNLLINANNLKMHQDKLVYTVVSIFLAANAILITGYFQSNSEEKTLCLLTISFFGIILSIIWYFIGMSLLNYQRFYEKLVERFETDLYIIHEYQSGIFNPLFKQYIPKRYIKKGIRNIPLFFIIFWIFFFVYSILWLYHSFNDC